MRAWWIAMGLVFLLASWSGASHAEDAAAAYARAVKLFEKKKYDEALPVFRQALSESGSPNARLFVARCLREMGDLPGAYNEMRRTLVDATKRAEEEEKFAPTRDAAAAELAVLETKVGRLVVAVADPPERTEVRLDDRTLGPEQIGEPIAVRPGSVRIVVEAPGKRRVERTVEVAAGVTRTVALALTDLQADPQPGEPSGGEGDEEPDDDEPVGTVRVAGFVVTGIGVVGLGVFAGLAVKAKADYDELDAACGGQPCPPSEKERVDDGRTLSTIGFVTLGVSCGLVATGVAMIIFGGADEDEDTVSFAPMVDASGAGVALLGRW